MSQYAFFGASVDDVRRRLPGDLALGGASAIEAALGDAEARVEAALPNRYRQLLRRVEGEVLVPAAAEGQLSAAVGLPAASGLVLYPDFVGPYANRSPADAMDPSTYTLDDAGELVTFSPALARGTRILADYDTTLAGGSRALADLAAALAAAQLARAACFGRPELAETLARDADARLAALADGRAGVPELDALRFVEDVEPTPRGTTVGYLGGTRVGYLERV
jgi:hypothetical protein